MTVTAHVYGKFAQHLANGEIDLDGDTLKAIIVDDGYTQDIDADEYLDDVQAHEVTGTGYTAGGVTLASASISYDSENNRVKVDFGDPSWPDSTITGRGIIVYVDSGTASTSPLVVAQLSDTDIISTGAEWKATLDSVGLLTLTVV